MRVYYRVTGEAVQECATVCPFRTYISMPMVGSIMCGDGECYYGKFMLKIQYDKPLI